MKPSATTYQLAVGVAFVAALLPFYLKLAVGIIDPLDGSIIWMEFVVLAVGLMEVILARFQPCGMAQALIAAALTQALVSVVALAILSGYPSSPSLGILGAHALFVALFLGSAWLFQKAARKQVLVSAELGSDPRAGDRIGGPHT